jgi:serine/threonine protein kinase
VSRRIPILNPEERLRCFFETAMGSNPPAASGEDDPWASLPALVEAARSGGWLIDAGEIEFGASSPARTTAPGTASGSSTSSETETEFGTCLGKGSSGSITLARWRGTPVAAKHVRVDTPSRATSFLREVRALARMRHPHILPFYGACLSPPDACWIVARACRGGTLRNWLYPKGDPDDVPPLVRAIRGSGSPPLAQRLSVARQIASAMCHLQDSTPPLAHRDLKPGNVFLLEGGGSGSKKRDASTPSPPKRDEASAERRGASTETADVAVGRFEDAPFVVVADFGLAREVGTKGRDGEVQAPAVEGRQEGTEDPETGRIAESMKTSSPPEAAESAVHMTGETGTYLYMAPEVVRHEPYDTSCDVWSFGVLLHELISGAPPYRTQRRENMMTGAQIAVGVADGRVHLETEIKNDVSQSVHLNGITAIARKCLERERENRPTFREIRIALDAMLPVLLEDLELAAENAKKNSLKEQLAGAFRGALAFAAETAATVRESLDIRDPEHSEEFEPEPEDARSNEPATVSLEAFLSKEEDSGEGQEKTRAEPEPSARRHDSY